MSLINSIRSNNALNMFTATGFRGRAAFRVGGAAAAGALAGHNVGDGHAVAGGLLGGLAGAGGHLAMRGNSLKSTFPGIAQRFGGKPRPWLMKLSGIF